MVTPVFMLLFYLLTCLYGVVSTALYRFGHFGLIKRGGSLFSVGRIGFLRCIQKLYPSTVMQEGIERYTLGTRSS